MARWVLPTPGGPRKTTFSRRSTKPSSCRLGQDEGRTRRERVQEQTLVAIESVARPLARCGVHAHIGDVVELRPYERASCCITTCVDLATGADCAYR